MAEWERYPPQLYNIVTGFFPEASPKDKWAVNPRPLLVCGRAQDPETGTFFCRIAYGTSQHLHKAHEDDLVVGNLSMLNALNLKCPTRFVINSGQQMVIMPWVEAHFQPWTGFPSPVLSLLPDLMQKHVGFTLSRLDDLPPY